MLINMSEVWRDIPGYEGLYEVSNLGRVRSLARTDRLGRRQGGKLIALSLNKRWGRLQCGLFRDGCGKTFRVHNLVALAFLGPVPHGKEVDHLDGNKLNNRAENLEYVTHHVNILRACEHGLIDKKGEKHHGAKLNAQQVSEIRRLSSEGTKGIELAERYGVQRSQISRIINGKRWARDNWREDFPAVEAVGR